MADAFLFLSRQLSRIHRPYNASSSRLPVIIIFLKNMPFFEMPFVSVVYVLFFARIDKKLQKISETL